MELTIPIENQEIPQTGLENAADKNFSMGRHVTALDLEFDPKRNELKGSWEEPEESDYYFNFQFYTSNTNPDGSMLKEGITSKSRAGIKGLPRGQRVFLRVRFIRNTWLGPWSDAIEKWIP